MRRLFAALGARLFGVSTLPPLVEPCPRCKGTGYDPEIEDDDGDASICFECYGVGKQLTDAGRQVAEVEAVAEARVDGRMDARYGENNPNDPRRHSSL